MRTMRTKAIFVLCVMAVSFLSFTTGNQEVLSAVATYDGYEYEEYNFSIAGADDEEDSYIYFSKISSDILKSYDLKSEKLVGEKFKITYEIIPSTETEDGEFTDESYVLKSLKKM